MASFLNKIKRGTGALPQSHSEQSHEQSLTTILSTHEDKSELLLIVANCVGSMRRQVIDIFDPERGHESWTRSLSTLSGKDQTLAHSGESTEAEAAKSSKGTSPAQEEEARKKRYERRAKELSSSEMIALRDATLNHFDTWRDKVIQRLGEAINQHQDDEFDASKNMPQTHSREDELSQELEDPESDHALEQPYPPQETPLRSLPQAQRVLILHSLVLLLLSLEAYTAESRVLLLRITSSLGLPMKILAKDEAQVAKGLLESAKQQMNADADTKKKAEENASSRKWKVGLGAAAGAVLIGVTGGLAAPLLAAGVGSLMGGIGLGATATAGYLGALAGSAPLVGALFGAYGGRMTGRAIDQYAREVDDFAFIPLHKTHGFHIKDAEGDSRHLRVAIGISGYLNDESEVVKPWQVIGNSVEGFALRWEVKSLVKLGSALTTYIRSYAWGWAKKEVISRTILATLASALTLPYGIAKATKLVDNPWSVAASRSDKAGKVLAQALISRVQGERPVTLLGYSLGARLIYSCLDELADRRAYGLVESVVLAGAAAPSDSVTWRKLRAVVSGRLINVYSTNDYLLGILYRTSSLQYGIAGLQTIEDVPGIENVDASSIVDGHTQYRFLIGRILGQVGLEDIDVGEEEQQMRDLRQSQKKDAEEREKSEKEEKMVENASSGP
ncbi:uncharacterized protein A1O9_11652 [Exophiala aquamarina CBS 119918]|uniref:DUF726-domain-containing protein n=1 Tax=Exophiala aquamarina CBS 119918 TaxID=1182545 RepID=A0A072NXT2_9EURO|nr:uncharacterized protein A1O9_11652 [Exophiala aquamarina CBS 119918]KEF52411.1 hypothetical protein A1O9_11652 [Exophiala aquamarina CBS 119918]